MVSSGLVDMATIASNAPASPTETRAGGNVITPLMRSRGIAGVLATAGTIHIVTAWLHLTGIPCPMLRTVGVPCPGCGGSRACAALLEGHLHEAVHRHA